MVMRKPERVRLHPEPGGCTSCPGGEFRSSLAKYATTQACLTPVTDRLRTPDLGCQQSALSYHTVALAYHHPRMIFETALVSSEVVFADRKLSD